MCTLFILDPGLLGPGIRVPGIGQPSPALVAFIFYFVLLFVYRFVGCDDGDDVTAYAGYPCPSSIRRQQSMRGPSIA